MAEDQIILPRLKKLIIKERLPHALLFVGSNTGLAKKSALEAARAIECSASASNSPCQGCEHCRLIQAGNHPDVQVIDCSAFEGEAMDVLREVLTAAFRKPFLGKSRVTILLHSEQLSIAALNLLLKTLEEPRPGNYYILTTPSTSLLPSTIISRSQVWFFPDDLLAMPTLDASDASLLTNSLASVAAGEMHSAILLATKIHKDFKDSLSLVLSTLSRFAREQLLNSESLPSTQKWSRFLGDLSELEHTIGTRNFNSQYQFAWVFERLAT